MTAPAALSGELGFATARALLDEHGGSAVAELDLSGVKRVDSAGLALLLELKRESTAPDGLRFVNAPPQLRQLADFFGLSDLLKLA